VTTLAFAGAGRIASVHALAAEALGVRVVEPPARADVVVVCSEVSRRAADALAALQQGAAVIVEKPLCATLAEADALVEAAGGRLAYAENLAFAPVMVRALAMAPSLGPLHHVEVRATQPERTWGEVATALLLAGEASPGSVSATVFTDERAGIRLEFGTGLVATIESSWVRDTSPVWDFQAASATGVLRGQLLPAPGLEHNGDPVPLPPLRVRGAPAQLEQYGYVDQLRSFLDDFAAGRPPAVDAAFGRAVLRIVEAARASL